MSLAKRIIPCLDVDNGRVVKGVKFVDIRDAGDPVEVARRYDREGADEITFLDITATHHDRDTIVHVVEQVASEVFIPLTVGGGIRKLEDIRRHTIIGESLDRVSALMRMQYPVSDIPEPDSCLKTMEVFLCHLTKHVSIYPTSVENCREWCEVYERIADALGLELNRHPLLSVAMAVTSPLQVHGMNVDIMKMAIERNFPIISTVCPMAGTTAPCTVAGTALLSNVEALAPVLIAQACKPGHPVLFGFGPSATNMRTGHDLYYKAEKVFFKTIACQMGKFYRLPISGEAGGAMTWRPDVQNGAEGMAYLLASHLGGQNLIGGVGSMDNANGMSGEQIIMQCGLIDMAEYIARGVEFSEHTLACASIQHVGPGVQDRRQRSLRAAEVGDQQFDAHARELAPEGPHRRREDRILAG